MCGLRRYSRWDHVAVETLQSTDSSSSGAHNFATPTRIRMIPRVMRVTYTSLTETKHARSIASRPGSGDTRAGTSILG
jgi:hypothetical protein